MMKSSTNGKGNTTDRDEWETPSDFFEVLMKQYQFDFDCCATVKNTKCSYFTDNFESERDLSCAISWMNPPFSKAWIMFRHFFKIVKKGVAIYRCDNLETGIWQSVIFPNSDWIFFPKSRINYEGLDGDGARFPSALIGKGVPIPINISGFVMTGIKCVVSCNDFVKIHQSQKRLNEVMPNSSHD